MKKTKPDVVEVFTALLSVIAYISMSMFDVCSISITCYTSPSQAQGRVIESLPGAMFKVELEPSKKTALCTISGKIRKNYVKILVGDPVTVELSVYDISRGRITFRHKLQQ